MVSSLFKLNDLDGEYRVCIAITNGVYGDLNGVLSVKTNLKFQNEYTKGIYYNRAYYY